MKKRVATKNQLLKSAKRLINWVINNTRLFLEIVLILALLVAGWMYRQKEQALEKVTAQYGKLAENLQSQITIKDGELRILKRVGDKIVIQKIYVPVEAPVTIDQPNPTPGNPNPEPVVTVKTRGTCFKPGVGVEVGSKGLQAHLDAKVGFWDRYSALVGGSRYGIGVGVSRHLDDILFFKPKTVEFFGFYSLLRATDMSPFTVGLRTNF